MSSPNFEKNAYVLAIVKVNNRLSESDFANKSWISCHVLDCLPNTGTPVADIAD